MQLIKGEKVIQVEWVSQWNDDHGSGEQCCRLSSLGWAQRPLPAKGQMVSTQGRAWWKERVSGNQEVASKTRPSLNKHTGVLLEVSYLRALQTQIGNWGGAWNERWWCGRNAGMPGWRVGKAKVMWEQLERRITDCGHPELLVFCSRL